MQLIPPIGGKAGMARTDASRLTKATGNTKKGEQVKSSTAKIVVISCVAIGFLFMSIAVNARNVSNMRHPNLAAAQTLIEKAIDKVTAAQQANEFDMKGHAAKAKSLLHQAYDEIKLAAEAANTAKANK
jgi:hypothetical protein